LDCQGFYSPAQKSVGPAKLTKFNNFLYTDVRALRGCGLVLKNRKTAHQNRGFGVIF